MKTIRTLVSTLAALLLAGVPCLAQYAPSGGEAVSRIAGVFAASQYNYPSQNNYVTIGNSATGSATITVAVAAVKLPDGRTIYPYANVVPIIVGGPTNMELVTPTTVSNCYSLTTPGQGTCQITATFANTHGFGDPVQSASGGAAEATWDAFNAGGGVVVIDNQWAGGVITGCTNCYASANAALTSIPVFGTVSLWDTRTGFGQAWTAAGNATILAAPTTLTATTVGFGINGANTTSGTYNGASTYHYCIAYVDPMGNEGPCSADFSAATAGTGSTNQIGLSAPAASTGAVGYTVYISLAGGTYNLTYQVPLTSSVCTLTKIETVTPACAVANTTYNQSGSAAIVSALTVNTAPLHLLATTASTTAAYIGTPSGRTVYAYAPTGTTSSQGLTSVQQAFTVAAATASTVPGVVATIPVPIGSMNFLGRTLCVEGQATIASAGTTATVQNIEFLWDAAGSNTAGAPVIVGQLQMTVTGVGSLAEFYGFHECFTTTVTGSGVTAGSLTGNGGLLNYVEGAGTLHSAGTDVLSASAVGSLNLAGTGGNTQRLHAVWLHTTGTDGAGMKVTGLRAWWQ